MTTKKNKRKGGEVKVSPELVKEPSSHGARARTTPEGLTEQQERFCIEYFRLGVATDAYKIAYPAALEWKPASVECNASKMLADTKVGQRIAALRKQASDKAVITEARVLKEAASIAFSDVRQLFDATGRIKPMSEWPEGIAAAVSSIEVLHSATGDPISTTKIKLWNKDSALEKLLKHMGMYEKDNRQKAPILANLDKLPLEVQQIIVEKLHAIASNSRPVVP